jgi:predicted RNA binding protein YcfA (HicA-like mRNA interferase family)
VSGGLPRGVSGRQAAAALQRAGFKPLRTSGDHLILKTATPRPGAWATVAVPQHRELKVGTLAGILRSIGFTAEEFRALLDRR